ncbi:YaiI/YqxD family protein [Pseudidiomarina marina]|uniref:UPF0178 protein CWI76_09305 n=1 Tax=Pseudidiomarina marina TaxID=502366 RepID=A0A432YE00_9GAMM|nr:YaiI/YqxD family protein [Pseudidiomarina marina]RUO59220.1 YaiI/YqxD family protein [Pseudidiomarina marina]
MKIYVDADACPAVIKDILYRAAERKQLELILVANQPLRVPPSKWIKTKQVESGFDVADNYIAEICEAGDLVITADIPLAADVIKKHGQALSPRGELFTKENIGSRLNMRDFMDTLRSSGEHTGGPPPLHQRDRMTFANELDKILSRIKI